MKQKEKPAYYVPFYEKLSFSLIDGGYSMINFLLTSYLTIYLTDVIGIAGMVVSGLLIVARVFDAINDPIIGSLADRTHTRFGRYRPWVFCGSIVSAVLLVLLFSNDPDWPAGAKTAYAVAIYMLLTLATTSMYIPQLALNTVITDDNRQRSTIATLRMVTSGLGTVIIPMVTMRLVLGFSGGETATAGGYSRAVALIAVVAMICGLIGAVVTKERLQPAGKKKNGIPIRRQIRAMLKNPAILLLFLCFVMHGLIAYGRGGVMLYYFTYYVGKPELYSFMGLAGLVGSFAGPILIGSALMKWIPHKGKAAPLALAVVGVSYLGMGVLDANTPVWWILCVLACVFQSAFSTVAFAALPEACDYGELISGFRVDGFLSSAISFGLKLGSAVGPALYLAAYDAAGYQANQAQNAQVLKLMNASVTFIPAVLVLSVGALVFFGYRISPRKHQEIMDELNRRRAE